MGLYKPLLPTSILLVTFITMSSWTLYEAFVRFDDLYTNAIMHIQRADMLGSLRWKTWYITAILYSYYENQGSLNNKILNEIIGFMQEFAEFKEKYDAVKFWPNIEPTGNMTDQLNILIDFAKNSNSNVANNDLFERASNNTEYVSSTIKRTENQFNKTYQNLHKDYLVLNIIIWASLFSIITILIVTNVYFLISYQRSSNTVVDRVSREKNKFIRYVFHEIRNPLQAVHLGLDQIMNSEIKLLLQYLPEIYKKDGWDLASRRDSILEDMKHATEIMTQLVNDCLDLQQIEYGTFETHMKHCVMKTIIDKSVAAAKSIADTKNIEILTELANDLYVNVDPIRIQQVITNLLSNAIKFSNINSIVRVSCNEYGLLSIEDYGPGIAEDQIKKIFEPFNPEADHHQRGSGLGLSIVKSIVAKHNTTIDLTSRPGHTKFCIKLEICDGSGCKDRSDIEQSVRGASLYQSLVQKQLEILLVEDNIVSQKVTAKFLENLNMNVEIANNGQEAVELSSSKRFDCILMDKEMPVMNGYEATKTIRGLGNYDVIIGLTGNALKEDIEEFKRQGVNDVLTKPLNVQTFIKTLIKMNIMKNEGGDSNI